MSASHDPKSPAGTVPPSGSVLWTSVINDQPYDRGVGEQRDITTWRMPAETDPHERTWMAFPRSWSIASEGSADVARATWSAVAHAIIEFEPVTMVVDPADISVARASLSSQIEIVEAPLDDAWMRDIGPTFVVDDGGRLGAVDWMFNGWGQQEGIDWANDSEIGDVVARAAGAELIGSPMVNEGGGIHVDGNGTVLATDTVQLDPQRNPDWTKPSVEAEFARTIGAEHVIWLPRGLTRDYERFGTRGHVDIVATIAAPGVLLVHAQRDTAHPDHAVTKQIIDVLAGSYDAAGSSWHIIEVPAPVTLRDEVDWVDYSYINHLVVNGGVIAGSFGDANDDQARGILSDAYPGRDVVLVESRPLFARGGGIHCITQQQPRPSV